MPRRWLFLAGLLLAAAGSLHADDDSAAYRRALDAGARGEWDQARASLVECRAARPEHIATRRALELLDELAAGALDGATARLIFEGLRAHSGEDWRRAAEWYRRALTRRPGYAYLLHNLGTVLYESGDTSGAIRAYGQALEHAPDYPYTHNNLGLAYARLGRGEEACEHYRRAIAIDSRYHKAYHNLATSLQELGRLDEAIQAYRTALEIHPGYALAATGLAYAEWLKGQQSPSSPRPAPASAAATTILIDRLESGDWQDREDAIVALAGRPLEEVEQPLLERLEHDRAEVRAAAVRALTPFRAPAAVPFFAKLLERDPAWIVRFHAATALSYSGDRTAAERLRRALARDTSLNVRRAIPRSLARFPDCATGWALVAALRDPVLDVRRAVLDVAREATGVTSTDPRVWEQLLIEAGCTREATPGPTPPP